MLLLSIAKSHASSAREMSPPRIDLLVYGREQLKNRSFTMASHAVFDHASGLAVSQWHQYLQKEKVFVRFSRSPQIYIASPSFHVQCTVKWSLHWCITSNQIFHNYFNKVRWIRFSWFEQNHSTQDTGAHCLLWYRKASCSGVSLQCKNIPYGCKVQNRLVQNIWLNSELPDPESRAPLPQNMHSRD
jgi:hypothetical protein